MSWYSREPQEEVSTEIDPDEKYTKSQLSNIADAILREDSRKELCRECGEPGEESGSLTKAQEAEDDAGHKLILEFDRYKCANDHVWCTGEGKVRGIKGDNPILFEEHLQSRRRREIYNTQGIPEPNIVSGMYNKTHPQGRKVNSEAQRKRNGASYYR